MGNIFSYARDKIKKKYENRSDFSSEEVKNIDEMLELDDIDLYEEKAKTNFVAQITCRIKAFWYVQTFDEKVYIGLTIAVILLELYILLYNTSNTPLNISILKSSKDFFFYFEVLGIIYIYRLIRKKVIKRKLFYLLYEA